ncbi:putative RNA-binding Zn-ribbon protein involved in translation (DUF1610 family) [Paenibacillus mucilaginosus]
MVCDRFKDPRINWYDFADHLQVRCPDCGKCAIVKPKISEQQTSSYIKKKFFLCNYCGKFEEEAGDHELWLKTTCCGNLLWAYNIDHLNFIKDYVRAKIRESNYHEKYGWYNEATEELTLFPQEPRISHKKAIYPHF